MNVHLDTDFLVYALSVAGPERRKLTGIAASEAQIRMSAVAWYEFTRGPRTPEQLAVARGLLMEDGIIAFSEDLAWRAAEVFRSLGSPRKRSADIAIGVTAAVNDAVLLTRNSQDFAGIPNLRLEAVPRKASREVPFAEDLVDVPHGAESRTKLPPSRRRKKAGLKGGIEAKAKEYVAQNRSPR